MTSALWGVLSVESCAIWDNRNTNKAAPGSAPTPSIQGPRRLARSRLMFDATRLHAPNGGAA